MKIAILTFSKVNNYGATLQCYALSTILRRLGHEVVLLDYQLPRSKSLNPIYRFHQFVQKILFEKFRNRYLPPFSIPLKSKSDLQKLYPKADLYVVGSDQVWNPNITRDAGVGVYFFDFLPDNVRRIAYAASFGVSQTDVFGEYSQVSSLLKKFNSIGVREISGISICQTLANRDATLVVDPTLLLGDYSIFLKKEKPKGVCLFNFQNNPYFYDAANFFAEQLDTSALILASYKRKRGLRNKL